MCVWLCLCLCVWVCVCVYVCVCIRVVCMHVHSTLNNLVSIMNHTQSYLSISVLGEKKSQSVTSLSWDILNLLSVGLLPKQVWTDTNVVCSWSFCTCKLKKGSQNCQIKGVIRFKLAVMTQKYYVFIKYNWYRIWASIWNCLQNSCKHARPPPPKKKKNDW